MSSPELARARWRKSSRSGNTGNCVEVADNVRGIVAIRDSKDPGGPVLVVDPASFAAFTTTLKSAQL